MKREELIQRTAIALFVASYQTGELASPDDVKSVTAGAWELATILADAQPEGLTEHADICCCTTCLDPDPGAE